MRALSPLANWELTEVEAGERRRKNNESYVPISEATEVVQTNAGGRGGSSQGGGHWRSAKNTQPHEAAAAAGRSRAAAAHR
jgi:hypothetical protein